MIVGRGFVYADDYFLNSEDSIRTTSADPLQILFEVALHEINKGNFSAAIAVLESLDVKTQSPRVQLELARALFLDRRYQSAKEAFEMVLQRPDIPWAVKENIHRYLKEIDSNLGFIKFGFSIVSDSNPRNFTDSRQIRIAGQPLYIIPPKDNKEIVGVRYTVSGARAILDTGSLVGYLNASYLDFANSQFDRWGVDAGLLLSFKSWPRFKLRAGLEESYYDQEHLYEFPYIGLIFIPQPADQFRLNGELKIGHLRVPNARYLDATNLSLTTKTSKKVTKKILTSADIYLEKSIADERAYSYYGGSLGIGLNMSIYRNWQIKPSVSLGRRLYEAEDPFFAKTRRDTRKQFGFTLKNGDLKVFGFVPEVGVTYDENVSNIDFYSYDKIGIVLKFN